MEEKTELLYDEESVYYFSGDYDGSLGSAYDVMDGAL